MKMKLILYRVSLINLENRFLHNKILCKTLINSCNNNRRAKDTSFNRINKIFNYKTLCNKELKTHKKIKKLMNKKKKLFKIKP